MHFLLGVSGVWKSVFENAAGTRPPPPKKKCTQLTPPEKCTQLTLFSALDLRFAPWVLAVFRQNNNEEEFSSKGGQMMIFLTPLDALMPEMPNFMCSAVGL